jgi:predicted membrane channel-forming protein YqfA (hemolysin III family)
MKLDDLKTSWQEQVKEPTEQEYLAALSDALNQLEKETSKLDKSIKRRDFLEISIALLLIPVWCWKLFYSAGLMQTVGLIVLILACIYIPYKLLKAKRIKAPKSSSVVDFLRVEKQKLENQKKLLETVAWWYISPMFLGIILVTLGAQLDEFGVPHINPQMWSYYGFCILLVIGTYGLNKRAAKKQFSPMINKVDQRLKELAN